MRRWLLGILGALLLAPPVAAEPIEMGETFPKVLMPAPLEATQRDYLGLSDDQSFTLDQIKGRVVLVEMLNVLCPHCQKQTAPYNQLYKRLESDSTTRGQVKMFGVAVANTYEQIDDFVVIYNVLIPVVPDRRFGMHRAVRGGPTPFSIYVLRDAPGEVGVVAGTHLGQDHTSGLLGSPGPIRPGRPDVMGQDAAVIANAVKTSRLGIDMVMARYPLFYW